MPNLPGSVSWTHNHSIPPLRFIFEIITLTKTHRYDIAAIKVTKTKTHKWQRTTRIATDAVKTHRFNVNGLVETTKRHRWNAGGRVFRRRTHNFNILQQMSKTKTHKWNRLVKITSNTKTHKWNTIGRIFANRVHKWNAGGLVKPPAIKTHKYSIKQGVTKTKTHKWNILTPKIISTELEYYKSSNTADSLGGAIDTGTPIVHNTEHNLFDVITATESNTGDTEYRCLYVKNTSARSTLTNSKVWIHTPTPSPFTTVTIGLGTSAIAGTEQTVANESTSPTTVTFVSADGINNALSIGTLTAGQHKAVWIKRVVNSLSQAYDNDQFTLGFAGDTFASN